jgi:HD-like signal output (HDOD) protein
MCLQCISSHTRKSERDTCLDRRDRRKARLIALATEDFSVRSNFAHQLLSLLNESPVNLNLIKQVINYRPDLSSQILRLCNSSLFSQHQRLLGVEEVSVLLGCDRMKTIVLTCFLMDLARQWLSRREMRRFWHHSVLTAMLSERIAHSLGDCDDDQLYNHAYLGGLFHDVGRLPLLVVAKEENVVCADSCAFSCGSSLADEKECFGLDHCDVARLMGPLWNFFPACSDIIANHHCPDRAPWNRHLVGIVGAADIICETHCLKPICPAEPIGVPSSSSNDELFASFFPEMEAKERSDLIETLQTEFLHLLPLLEFEFDNFGDALEET